MEVWKLALIAIIGAVTTMTGFGLSTGNYPVNWLGVGICCIGLIMCVIDIHLCTKEI